MKKSSFSFLQPKLPQNNHVEFVADNVFRTLHLGNFVLPSFPPKRLLEIVKLVQDGKNNEISIFEWLDAIEDQSQWTQLTEEQNIEACKATWLAISTDPVLADVALFNMALYFDGKKVGIVKNIPESIGLAQEFNDYSSHEKLKIDWLFALKENNFRQLANHCCQKQCAIIALIRDLNLPQANSYFTKVIQCIFDCIKNKEVDASSDAWLYSNYISLKTTQQRIDFLERFVDKFRTLNYGELCEELITKHCLPTEMENFWSYLQFETKQILKVKFKLSSYFDLRSISSALFSTQAVETLGFDELQTKQIRSRSMFWSNYSDRFERVRVLMSQKSFDFVKAHNKGSPPFVDCIDDNGLTNTEVYIFELGKIIVVEFLRGYLSETRFFKNEPWYSMRLFESEKITTAEIRAMSQQDVHDHLVGWQYFCERLLRTRYKIVPNGNTKIFKGLPRSVKQYQKGVGLVVAPDERMLKERRGQLEHWVERFWTSELQTGKFGDLAGLEQKSTLYLSKALMAKQLGNQDDYELFIKKAANQGSAEAMWQLGRTMLLGSKSDANTRCFGQQWIGKAAAKGHKEAKEKADRFGIPYY